MFSPSVRVNFAIFLTRAFADRPLENVGESGDGGKSAPREAKRV